MTLKPKNRTSGFTLIELLVVVLIIGILAAIAVPQYFKVVEKGKFAESMQWLNGLKGAQERYLAKNGTYYAGTVVAATFDANLGTMSKFNAGAVTTSITGGAPAWSIVLTRSGTAPAVYGNYTITYTAPPGTMTCGGSGGAACTADLMP